MHYIFQNPKTISEIASTCKTPFDVLLWMRTHIRHGDHDDSIQLPQSSITKRVCSYLEFAWLFHEILSIKGINSYIITIKGNSKSVACLFEVEGKKLKCMVNRWTMLRKYSSIDSAIPHIDRDWFRWIEWAVLRGRLVPVKPHYRNGDHGESKDTRSYLLRDRLSSLR